MKKFIIILLILISSFAINSHVLAAPDASNTTQATTTSNSENCGAFGSPTSKGTFAYYLQQAFNIIKFLGIILAIIMTIKDLMNAVAEQKNDTLAKLGKTTLKRIIYAIAIFFLPTILNMLFSVLGLYGTCGII